MRRYLLFEFLFQICTANLILNGGFELPVVTSSFITACPLSWSCCPINSTNVLQYSYNSYSSFPSQIIRLKLAWIAQGVTISQNGTYLLQFKYSSSISQLSTFDVFWNNTVIQTVTFGNSAPKSIFNFTIDLAPGNGIFNISSTQYLYIDNVSITLMPPPSPSPQSSPSWIATHFPDNIIQKVGTALSAPISSISTFSGLYLLLEDCWLFNYAHKTYKPPMLQVFETIQQIDSYKLRAFSLLTNIELSDCLLAISNYTNFTDPKFVEIEDSSSILIQAIFPFLVFSVPQTVFWCFFFYAVFKFTKRCANMRKIFKQYYFLKEIIIFTIIEQNIAYFVFVCCGHYSIAFFFKPVDKLAFIFTVVMGFAIITFTVVFYFFLGRYAQAQTATFNNNIRKRFHGHFLLTVKDSFRSLVRGGLFFYFRGHFITLMIVLGVFQLLMFLFVIFMNNRRKTGLFEKKILFCLNIIYYVIFAGLHFSLAIEEICKENYAQFPEIENIILQLETIILFLMVGYIGLGIIFDLIPATWLPQVNGNDDKRQIEDEDKQNQMNGGKFKKYALQNSYKAKMKNNKNPKDNHKINKKTKNRIKRKNRFQETKVNKKRRNQKENKENKQSKFSNNRSKIKPEYLKGNDAYKQIKYRNHTYEVPERRQNFEIRIEYQQKSKVETSKEAKLNLKKCRY